MAELLFKNLPYLLNDMEQKGWVIDSFPFRYKEEAYFVILTLYKENQRKPSEYAKAKVEFIKTNNINDSINAYIDFYNVYFNSSEEFCDFFGVNIRNVNRDIFKDFSKIFADFIPKEKTINKNDTERRLIGSRAEGNNPMAIYCYDVHRNGRKQDGSLNQRSIENSNKAQSLRPELYEHYCNDMNLSFFFSDSLEDEKSDEEIMAIFANR
ncbi:hypothetical protein SAMN02745163_03766 [Clostridium cavendishii DSM 21758]|uniref:Uncharacterized protein n=1 Tax=Clostridium cavendishii DSM 21758 TaxID=1121302 RepID=A0A1M6SBZ9_9CLOT|nr:DUF6037 family protein [Clostridium cavendishii]SHK42159.1 hypothetical protein SAMN02745163_03766 [Clostridium cavendishii DSM 21758]